MSAETAGVPDPTELERQTPPLAPQPTFGGEPAPGDAPAPAPALPLDGGEKPVLGLGGDPIDVPGGVWYAATDERGQLLRDAEGRVVRARQPSSRPRTPLTDLVAGTLAP